MLAVALAAAALASPQPALTILSADPLAVRGTHFAARERVRVRITGGGADARRRVTTGRRGGFRVTFGAGAVGDRCSGFVVRATGVTGDSAQLVRKPLPACAP